ncbi:zinc finger SWIM domain-containing protein 7 isoform X1 [Fukomys damarensis]|uniref:zinc finger SWIM domain-containing protein 7 isoform X1 n=1 Tax=Fukomys damarensis TaxID=885580 RepID=UPI001455C293|nr:zinc finger SWIM domain-containing protein 7 isoform X1 [Fukomys damarensis]
MAVALPAVVEELLSEVAAAVRECARSTGLSRAWLRCGPRAGRGVEAGRAGGASKPGALSSAPRPDHCALGSALFPDEHLLSLKFVFGSSAIQALDLVDRQSVTLISSPSGRRVYQVLGSSGKTYTCLASCHFCSCPAFAFSVLRKSDSLLCKHLLAVYLSQVMRTCQQLSVSDKQLTDILMEKK